MKVMKARPKVDEIARLARVSKATVDRVLNNRPGVQEHTRAHVASIVASLADDQVEASDSGKIPLDFILPGGTNPFIADLVRHLERQAAMRSDVDVAIHRLNGIEPEEVAEKLGSLRRSCQGVGLIGLDSPAVREAVRQCIGAGISVLTLVSDISHVGRVSYVGIDNRAAGRLAGYLIGRFMPGSKGKIALIAGALAYRGHEEREMGFRHVLDERFPLLEIIAVREVRENADKAYTEVQMLLKEQPELVGVYCIGAGHEGIVRALKEAGREKSVVFIGHDLTDDTRQYLLSGVMDAVIDQNAGVEAREAIDRLVRSTRGETPVSAATIRIQSVFSENIPADA
ncbi:LacI family DNA-binding transcriptional regulator [Pararhizobium sp. DWP1-1-3]|uniref:LacI family DNA-binding transcriptional regulator n=1 Tax=Pararhizobium sp. DWP1-1-3 TaxID=2804652 RepID=UPI003CF0FC14